MKLIIGELTPERLKYSANYIGSKMRLVNWIWTHTPPGVESVIDAFSGSAVVGYMYKTKGLRVIANDRLKYCYHTARAIIENNNVLLDPAEVDRLLVDHSGVRTFVREKFGELFFKPGVHRWIDIIRSNIEISQHGYQRDIALFALARTCVTCRGGGFGHFSSSTNFGERFNDEPDAFVKRFRNSVKMINALVIDNEKENHAFNGDVNNALAMTRNDPALAVDLAYFDPPYATQFSVTNYEKTYHFVEGLMDYWEGKVFSEKSKLNTYETNHEVVTRRSAYDFFRDYLENAQHIPHWIISYRDKAYPNEKEMARIIKEFGRDTRLESKEHQYYITTAHSDASLANELLYICNDPSAPQHGPFDEGADEQKMWKSLEEQLFN